MLRAMPERGRLRSILIRGIACVFFLYHLAAITLTNISTSTALGNNVHPWIRPYIRHTGLWQEWDMFTTIPYYQGIQGRLVATFPDQRTQEFGPLIPGFGETYTSLRVSSLFARIMWSRNAFQTNIGQWERTACHVVEAHSGEQPRHVQLKLDTQRLNTLSQVRSTGKIARPEQFTTRPAMCKKP
jgi:hypothetical protein